jgi:hypothetical protein
VGHSPLGKVLARAKQIQARTVGVVCKIKLKYTYLLQFFAGKQRANSTILVPAIW